jgi:murein L,D-transpeptidase YcbB/YkuD
MIRKTTHAAFFGAALTAAALGLHDPAGAAESRAWKPGVAMGPGAQARGISVILDHAYRHGIRLSTAQKPTHAAATDSDASLKALFMRYAKAVGFGQIAPETVRMSWDIPRSGFDESAARKAFDGNTLGSALGALPPPHPGYARLVRALARYRAIAAKGGWPRIPQGPSLSRGMGDPRVVVLRRRLAAEGADRVPRSQSEAFDAELEAAVIRFQRRHGLEPDGIVGPKTLTVLNVPVERRLSQILVNMERWRWLPRRLPARRAEVNIAAARLEVFDGPRLAFGMRVVVGSQRHPTPVLESSIKAVILNPPWNVPDSIWRREIFPKLRRDADYLAAHRMEIVDRPNDPHGRQIDWAAQRTPVAGIRIRQVPGPFNALGKVKFHTPNRFDVYLHDTPQRAFFKRAERALSHGCIRLQRPDKLLAYLIPGKRLRGNSSGSQTASRMTTKTLSVDRALPVFILYWTTSARRDGTVRFYNDIYGHDSRMTAALEQPGRSISSDFLASGCGGKRSET